MARADNPLDLQCPFRLISRLSYFAKEGKPISVNCIGSDCALFAIVSHGATGRKVTKGCSFAVLAKMLSKRWVWE